MSYKGLVEQERQAKLVAEKIRKSLNKELEGVKQEIEKVRYLLGNPTEAARWASGQAGDAQISRLLAQMTDVEQLYLNAGNSRAASIFKARMEKYLRGRLTNLQATELELKMRVTKSRQEITSQLTNGLTEVRREAALRESYDQAVGNGGFFANFGRPYLNDIVTLETKGAGSKTLGEYMSKLYTKYEQGLKDAFIHGIVRGDSYETIEKRLRETTDITAGKAKLLVRTEANAIFNESVREVIDDNPLVKGYRFRAVLDNRTSKICQEHDGEYIPKSEVKPGVNYPPLHPNCRSTVTTVLVGEDEKVDTVQRYTKNGKNQWEKVPPGMTYKEYKDKFGFSGSKKPSTYNPETRDIHDTTLARVTVHQYKGYVKPSASSTSRIQKMVKAYVNNDTETIDAILQNTGMKGAAQGLMRQAQAEAGFDGLPLQLSETRFNKQVEKDEMIKVYRKFGRDEDLEGFLRGDQPYQKTGDDVYGTKVFAEKPEDMNGVVEMALRTDRSKILTVHSRQAIREGITGDPRIDKILSTVPDSKRPAVFSSLSIEYGYDAVEFVEEANIAVLNRTAVVVKEPTVAPVIDVSDVQTPKYSQLVTRVEHIAGNDPRIVAPKSGPKYVPNVVASAVKLDHKLSGNISPAAKAIYNSAVKNEAKLTESLLKVVDDFEGSRLDGIEYCVKTGSSTEDKIRRVIEKVKVKEGIVIDDVEALKRMDD
nr:MAG TPA: minor capsid protein [Caudoviricetes sp.]